MKRNGETYYYITNLQGDVMKLVDAEGNVVASYEYDPYGKILSATGTMANANPLRYRGYYYDSELGMYYLQSRYYDPNTGRFINADDVSMLGASGTVIGYNLFAYCENNPINMVDTHGTFSASVIRTGYLKYRLVGYFSDQDVRNIKAGIIVTGTIVTAVFGAIGVAGGIPSMGISVVAAGIGGIITTAITALITNEIDRCNYGKGATLSFDFGVRIHYYYRFRYGTYWTIFGPRWGVIGVTKHPVYTPYLRRVPYLKWIK